MSPPRNLRYPLRGALEKIRDLISAVIEEGRRPVSFGRHMRNVGSGTVAMLGIGGTAIALLWIDRVAGWDPTWRTFGVTPLHPPFFDMHIINDYAACAWKGVDPYAAHACSAANYNITPTWLWLGLLGVNGSHSNLLSIAMITAAVIVIVLLLRGRSWPHGLIGLGAIISPSVMMGVERANLDLLILALVGAAALFYDERKSGRASGAIALVVLGVVLKLFPMFCISLAARLNKRALIFVITLSILSLIYLYLTIQYVFLIRQNVPTTFILSYGYKAIFLGVDHIRGEAGVGPLGLAETWLPALTATAVLVCAAAVAVQGFRNGSKVCSVDLSTAGTAFLFGAGIYCGTYVLGTNFIYRLMFLLLCVPQFQDWQIQKVEGNAPGGILELCLFGTVLGVLWSNGNANGHSIFLLLPQLLDWFLFFGMTAVLILNFLRSSFDFCFAHHGPAQPP